MKPIDEVRRYQQQHAIYVKNSKFQKIRNYYAIINEIDAECVDNGPKSYAAPPFLLPKRQFGSIILEELIAERHRQPTKQKTL